MSRCPCLTLKSGAALLTVAASMIAQARAVFGGEFGPALARVLHGAASLEVVLPVIAVAVMAAAGFVTTLRGLRATQTHYDPFDGMALGRTVGGLVLFIYAINAGWGLDPYAWCGSLAAFGRALLLAGLVYNVAALWLQLRGPLAEFVGDLRAPSLPPSQDWSNDAGQLAALAQEVEQHQYALAAWQQAVAARDHAIAALTDERNRLADDLARKDASCEKFRAHGLRYKQQAAETDLVLRFPGALRALEKAVHPNAHGGASPEILRRAHEAACAVSAIRERLKAPR